MTTEEVEALLMTYRTVYDAAKGLDAAQRAGVEAVARAVRAQDAARGGTLTAEQLAEYERQAEDGWSIGASTTLLLLRHNAAQGRANAALEKERDDLNRRLRSMEDASCKHHEWFREEKERADAAEAKLAKAQARAEQAEGQQRSDMAKVEQWRKRATTAESAFATLRQAVAKLRKPAGHDGDEEGGQCDEDCDLCLWDALQAMVEDFSTPAEHPDTQRLATLQAIRELAERRVTFVGEDFTAGHRAAMDKVLRLLGDSGPSETREHPDTAMLRGIRERADDIDTLEAVWSESPQMLRARIVALAAFISYGKRNGDWRADAWRRCTPDCSGWNDDTHNHHTPTSYSCDEDSGEHVWRRGESGPCLCGSQTRLLGDSGPSGGGEKRPMGHPGAGDSPAEVERAKPTTPPDVAASEPTCRCGHPQTLHLDRRWRCLTCDCEAFASPAQPSASEPEPTHEEDWRTVEQALGHSGWCKCSPCGCGADAALAALARLKAEPRRAAEAMRERCAKVARDCQCAGDSPGWRAAQAEIEDTIRALPL